MDFPLLPLGIFNKNTRSLLTINAIFVLYGANFAFGLPIFRDVYNFLEKHVASFDEKIKPAKK